MYNTFGRMLPGNEGFVHHPTQSLCTPNCSEPCINGECVETNKCECDFGYQFANESQSVCEPICELSCENAKCVEPNVCLCHNGYIVANESKPHECHCGLYCVEIDDYCHCLDEEHRVSGDRIRNNISSICSESNCMNGVCLTPYDCECKVFFFFLIFSFCLAIQDNEFLIVISFIFVFLLYFFVQVTKVLKKIRLIFVWQ